jgi:signal transduction histidine kinase/ActR/RegA family two-component response regulator/tetratricopeptide (TPR) repeat protein
MAAARIPSFELGAELGRGAHSVVLRGVRDHVTYAVKMPLVVETETERQVAYRRFLREAVALARVRHPCLPSVMEVGRTDGIPYLVMELAVGETLAERLERGAFDGPRTVELAVKLAGALDAIHGAGLVHRDVKPKNIVFDPDSGGVRLVDLGSAALVDRELGVAGTRSYIAPEVLGLEARAADPRSDLYSLGRVLFDCLGVVPMPTGDAALQSALVARGIGPELSAIFRSLVAPDPRDRPPSAAALLGLLGRATGASDGVVVQRARGRLLGRGLQLDQMRRAWAESQRSGRIVFLEGAAGTGKTQLAKAFLEELLDGEATILVAACHPRDPRAFSVIRQLVDDYLAQVAAEPPEAQEKAIAELRKLAGDLASPLKMLSPAVARIFRDAPTLPSSENAEQAFAEGLAGFLEKFLRKIGPAVVLVDDVQWLDPSSRRVLSRAANRIADLRGLFVFTSRVAGDDDGIAEVLTAPVTRIELSTLHDDEIVELARDYLAARELDAVVKQAVLRLSDGTPLGTLEVLRTLVDEGILLPLWGRWQLDADGLTAMHLPNEASSLLRRRIEALEPKVRSVLSVAAIIGSTFEVDLLTELEGETVPASLLDARWSQLVEPADEGYYRFIHQTVPEALLAVRPPRSVAEIHQRVAVALDDRRSQPSAVPSSRVALSASPRRSGDTQGASVSLDADPIYRLAFHYGSGILEQSPERAADANVAAGLAAVARFDNERAKTFFETAEKAFALQNRGLDAENRLLLAEARLRVGEHEDALAEFNRALAASSDPILRATAYGRIAFVRVMQLDTKRAWAALECAFDELGERIPTGQPAYAAGSVGAWLARLVVPERLRSTRTTVNPERDELLCSLYYETARTASESNQPLRILLSTMRALEPAERLGPSAVQAKTYLMYAFVLTLAGVPGLGARYLETGEQIGRRLRDPVIYSHALQLHSVIAAWGGRFQDAIVAGARCVQQYGHWRELNDFCLLCYTLFQLESSRGRDVEAWKWLDTALDRVNRHDGAPVLPEYLLLAARAGLVGLGREGDTRVLFQRLERVTVPIPSDSGSYAMTFCPRVRRFTDKMDLGPEYQAIVSEFRGMNQNPKNVHLSVAEYYLHIAHAAVNRALRATPSDRIAAMTELALALSDLRATARKFPVFRAHLAAVEGYDHFFHRRTTEAETCFNEAERLAIAETVPWVQYAVYRGRAHLLRQSGRLDGARDQAVLADSVAMEHGSVYRARWVRDEFALRPRRGADGSYPTGSVPDSALFDETQTFTAGGSRARRQLRALLRISRARAQELAPNHQSRVLVDELVQALRADRGFLFLTTSVAAAAGVKNEEVEASNLVFIAGRDSMGRDLDRLDDYHRPVVRAALVSAEDGADERTMRTATTARYCALAAPLIVDDLAVGVVYLDRSLAAGVFSPVDGEVLAVLAEQVSVALELTRTLRARERAEESVRNAEKMEAIARLARGIAHDLNNMLSAIRLATVAMMTEPGAGEAFGEDVRTIQSALQRANELTKQLGTFSRGQLVAPQLVRLNGRIERLLPVMEGLLGDPISIEANLSPKLPSVLLDPDQFDQLLMNLFINARDAMPDGGKIALEIAEVRLDDAYVREHPRVEPGRYVRLILSDTGVGIDENIRHKIFEPYFTTKQERGGTGLGLSSVYWIVSQSGGHIDVSSAIGAGATFTIHFPVPRRSAHSDSKRGRRPRLSGTSTILLVDQDAISSRSLGQTLAEHGHRVLSARSGAEALELARKRHEHIDLLVADVVMDGMNGLELARELRKLRPDLPVLLVSNDESGVLAERGILGGEIWGEVEIVPKPVQGDVLALRIKTALGRTQRNASPK